MNWRIAHAYSQRVSRAEAVSARAFAAAMVLLGATAGLAQNEGAGRAAPR